MEQRMRLEWLEEQARKMDVPGSNILNSVNLFGNSRMVMGAGALTSYIPGRSESQENMHEESGYKTVQSIHTCEENGSRNQINYLERVEEETHIPGIEVNDCYSHGAHSAHNSINPSLAIGGTEKLTEN